MVRRNSTASCSSVVMSLKTIPGLGKSGTSRMAAFSVSICDSRFIDGSLPDVKSAVAPR